MFKRKASAQQTQPEKIPAIDGRIIDDIEQPRKARWVMRGFVTGMVILVTWAAFAKINQVTRATAQVIVVARTQLVQTPDGGILTGLFVKEGDEVKQGQLIARMQKERALAAVNDAQGKVAALRITVTRLRAELTESNFVVPPDLKHYQELITAQTELYSKRRTAFVEDISSLEGILKISETELAMNKKLEASGDVSRADILRIERSVADTKAQIATRRNKYFQDVGQELSKAQEDLNTQEEQLKDRQQILVNTELTAPLAGTVNNVRVNTIGGVVRQGDTIVEILPSVTQENLLVEAKVAPADIATVSVGQNATIKLDAYDSSIYGSFHGKVTYISPDILTEENRANAQQLQHYYRVHILITGKDFTHGDRQLYVGDDCKKVRLNFDVCLRPGLTASVDIKALERTVLNYLTKPLTKTLSNSLGER